MTRPNLNGRQLVRIDASQIRAARSRAFARIASLRWSARETGDVFKGRLCRRAAPDEHFRADKRGACRVSLLRGIFYDGWRIAAKPSDERQPAEFATLVAADLPPSLARDASRVTRAVFGLLEKELGQGETEKIIATLPHPLRVLWPAPKSYETPPL